MGWNPFDDLKDELTNAFEFVGGKGDSAAHAQQELSKATDFVGEITGYRKFEDFFSEEIAPWFRDPLAEAERVFKPEFGMGDVNTTVRMPRTLTPQIDQSRIDSDYANAMRQRRGRAAAILGGGGGSGYGLVSRPSAGGAGSRALTG